MSAPAIPPLSGSDALPGLAVVRYSLPALLREVAIERNSPAFATEKLDQVEIAKLFQKTRARRAARARQ